MKHQYTKIFQKEFNDIAKHYDELEPIPESLHNLILNNIPRNRGSFLELGCGTGRILKMMIPVFKSCTGLDFSEKMIRIARRRVKNKAKFVICSVDDLNFKENSFDFIVCHAIFHHLNKDKKKLVETLKKIKNILKPNGRLLISDFVTYKLLRSKQNWIHYSYLSLASIKKGQLNLIKEIKKEPDSFRRHLVTEAGMFFTRKEFYELLGNSFENSRIGCFGRRRELIKTYYLIWGKRV